MDNEVNYNYIPQTAEDKMMERVDPAIQPYYPMHWGMPNMYSDTQTYYPFMYYSMYMDDPDPDPDYGYDRDRYDFRRRRRQFFPFLPFFPFPFFRRRFDFDDFFFPRRRY